MKSDKLLIEGCVDKINEITEAKDKAKSFSFGDYFDADGDCETVGDLIKWLSKFDKNYEIKFCDPDGVPVDWKIYSMWNSEYESEEYDESEEDETVWIRVSDEK